MVTSKHLGLGAIVYHVAEAESLASIQKHGLLSTREIYKRLGISDVEQSLIRVHRRKLSYALPPNSLGNVIIRDQRPLPPVGLAKALQDSGMSNDAWLDLLDERVFLWAKKSRFEALAKSYQSRPLIVLEINIDALLLKYAEKIEVAEFNTGYAMRHPVKRDANTFCSVANYKCSSKRPIVEVTVKTSLDVMEFVNFSNGSRVRVLKQAVLLSSGEPLIPEVS